MRALASIRRIDALDPIPGADKIWKATIGGWEVVTSKDNGFNVGDLVIYFEIDSWIPHEIAPFLTKEGKEPREFNGVKGEKLRTIRLRGQLSQGLIMPISIVPGLVETTDNSVGFDVTELLSIQKWEAPIPANMQGKMRGNFPSFIPKTDEERCQNLKYEIFEKWIDVHYEETLKMDGSSMTVYFRQFPEEVEEQAVIGVCSRKIDLDIHQEGNTFVDTAFKIGLPSALNEYCLENRLSLAIQGELVGPGIEKNKDGFPEHRFYVYKIFDIDNQAFLGPDERKQVFNELKAKVENPELFHHVPVLSYNITLPQMLKLGALESLDVAGLLKRAEGISSFGFANTQREGIVFKSMDGKVSWKAISNKYLEENGKD